MKMLWMLVLVVLGGCGQNQQKTGLSLQIELPSGLQREQRLKNLSARVVMAKIRLETKKGVVAEQTLATLNWDAVAVPQVDFPTVNSDSLSISVQIWDRTRDGRLRSYPVLNGHSTVKAAELNSGHPNVVPVRLSLAVSVSDYD